jgi:phage N-6-adenine-methyltransferase
VAPVHEERGVSDLDRLVQAERMLAEVANVDEARKLVDVAEAARVYARQVKLGTSSVNHATSIKLRAERRVADLVDEGQASGVIATKGNARSPSISTLADIGITSGRLAEHRLIRDTFTDDDITTMVAAADAADREVRRDALVEEARRGRSPHVTRNTGNDEWYTPGLYVDAARDVLGDIDLDPASSDIANGVVRAARYYTADDDGLARPWSGRVWMNPPYSTGLVDRFVARLLEAHEAKDVTAAVVLTNNATDTRWWQALARRSSSVCCLAGRVRFRSETGEVAGAGLQGQTVAYLGDDPMRFADRFAEYGVVL